jgi:hypothetical protein
MFRLIAIFSGKEIFIGSEVNKLLSNSVLCLSVQLLYWCLQTRSAIKLHTSGFGFY